MSRSELVVLLNALADDTRLRILRYVADNGEQRSQRIMSELELSQSTASRQLSHLCAAGFLHSRLCDGAKCYSLSEDRLRDTAQAVLAFLAISTLTASNMTIVALPAFDSRAAYSAPCPAH